MMPIALWSVTGVVLLISWWERTALALRISGRSLKGLVPDVLGMVARQFPASHSRPFLLPYHHSPGDTGVPVTSHACSYSTCSTASPSAGAMP